MPQPVALQLLFDLKFIGAATGGQLDEKYTALEAQIEHMVSRFIQAWFNRIKIDPFDLAVLTSHIQTNSSKAIQKSSILHGSLIASSGALQGKFWLQF